MLAMLVVITVAGATLAATGEVIFIIDSSGSVYLSSGDYTNWNKEIAFVRDAVNDLYMNDQSVSFGLINFSGCGAGTTFEACADPQSWNRLRIEFDLDDYDSLDEYNTQLDGMGEDDFTGGSTWTNDALGMAVDMFEASGNADAKKYVVLITDGAPFPADHEFYTSDGYESEELTALQSMGVRLNIITVGVSEDDINTYFDMAGIYFADGVTTGGYDSDSFYSPNPCSMMEAQYYSGDPTAYCAGDGSGWVVGDGATPFAGPDGTFYEDYNTYVNNLFPLFFPLYSIDLFSELAYTDITGSLLLPHVSSDTDRDGYTDGQETLRDTDPDDPDDTPSGVTVTLYVKEVNAGDKDGKTWDTALTDLQTAIDLAMPGDEIWVAKGTYYPASKPNIIIPDDTDDREMHFALKNGVNVYGGFSGDESSRDQRDPAANATILSGDIGVTDDVTDNCYHVLYNPPAARLDETAYLEGFTITGGNADGSTFVQEFGGGMLNFDSSSPTLVNCVFLRNHADTGGGAYSFASSPVFINCTFTGNIADSSGGGVFNIGDSASPILTGCIFSGNRAGDYGGAGIRNFNASATLTNCTFSGNEANAGDGIYNDLSTLVLTNSILWEDTIASAFTSSTTGFNSISVNPLFVRDPDAGDDGYWGTEDDDYGDFHLTDASPCIDAGTNTPVDVDDEEVDLPGEDMDGEVRISDGDFDEIKIIDIGADEFVDKDRDGLPDFTEGISVMVSPIGGNTAENGTEAEFTVSLNTRPDGNVVINIASGNTNEGAASPVALTFNASDWETPQTVTVTGVDDDLADGDRPFTVQLTIDTGSTTDTTGYAGLDPIDVSVINEDDETPGFTISDISGNTTEADGTATFTIALTSEPTADVTTAVSSSDETEGTVSPESVTFTSGNWNVAQTITVTGVDDDTVDGDQAYTIQTGVATSADANYSGLDPDDVTVVNTDDDDTASSNSGSGGCFIGTLMD